MAKSNARHGGGKVVQATKAKGEKPPKPRPNFPLFPHQSGKWAKVVRGHTHYFGRWDDPLAAEAEWDKVSGDLLAGRTPRPDGTVDSSGVTIKDCCNRFMKARRIKLDSEKLSPRTYIQYDRACRFLMDTLGANRLVSELGPPDFEKLYAKLSKIFGTTSLGGSITMVKMVFKHAFESDLIDRPLKYGPTFKAPTRTDIRKAKAKQKHEHGSRVFEAVEVRKLIESAQPQLKAMILLGANCAFGNTDCSSLPKSAVNLQSAWIDFPRQKTGAERCIPLWPETVEALKAVYSMKRKDPADPADAGLVFLTRLAQRWVRYSIVEQVSYGKKELKPKQDDGISKAMNSLLKELEIKRPGLSFYSLRHTFETVAGDSKDQVAVDAVMGHIDGSMAANYRHNIEDARLQAVVNHVRAWLCADELKK